MPELFDELDRAIDAVLSGGSPEVSAELEPLLADVRDLAGLPRPAFREMLEERMQPQTVTPYVTVNDPEIVIAFVKEAFGAEELGRGTGSAGGLHCEVRIGDSTLMIGGGTRKPIPEMPTMLHMFVPDVDAAHRRAIEAGAKELRPPVDQAYGERDSVVEDGAGNQWCLATSLGARYKPDVLRTVTMYLHPFGAGRLLDYVHDAFGAETLERHEAPDGKVLHAKAKIGNSIVEMGEAHEPWLPMPTMIFLSVDDADRAYDRALAAGGKAVMPPTDQPYGRTGAVEDPFGNHWYVVASRAA